MTNSIVAAVIDGTTYFLTEERSPGPAVARLFKLVKEHGANADAAVSYRDKKKVEPYFVKLFVDGKQTCSCPSHKFEKEDRGEACKHIECLQEHGFIPKGAP